MKKIIILNKKEGETPLSALHKFRAENKEYKNVKMTYAGRLDPMASGFLLILAGNEVKNKEKYLGFDKEYDFEVLFGFATDTYDILGKVTHSFSFGRGLKKEDIEKEIKKNLRSFLGETVQKYPIYSSKTIAGKPLFAYARAGEEVDAPERKIFIKKLKLEKIRKITGKKLFQNIEKRIGKVKGDFRQKEILKIWRQNMNSGYRVSTKQGLNFYIASFQIKCSSGTYVRGIAESLGKKMGVPALAFSIKRTKIGKWSRI